MTTLPLLPEAGSQEWLRVDPSIAATLLREAQRLHAGPAVLPTASEWAQYRIDGNRFNYENRLTALQDRLATATLAACMAPGGEGRDHWGRVAADDAWALCELTSWCLPAHYPSGARDKGRELPDPRDPVLDLDAGVTGALLAWAGTLLRRQWREAFPSVAERVRHEIRVRVLAPFIGRTHYWFGSPDAPPNNWAPWITANALACFVAVGTPAEQEKAVAVALPVLENFCAGYGPDGACEEGATYWWVAALTLFEALDFIKALTAGRVDRLNDPLLAAMGRYPHQMQIHGHWQVNFGDASPHMERAVRFHTAHRYAGAVGDADAALFARSMAGVLGQRDPARWTLPAPTGRNFHRMLLELLDPDWIAAGPQASWPMPYPETTFLPSTAVLCAREIAGSSDGLFLAVKDGDNGVSHNHNDAGSFTVFADGAPVIIDLGVETYSKATFDPAVRYTIWTMRSAFHNVPLVNGAEQRPGHAHGASGLRAWGTDDGAERSGLSMNLEQAYGPVAGLQSWTRTAELDRAGSRIEVVDLWEGPGVDAALTLVLAAEPVPETGPAFTVGNVRISHSPGWHATFERFDVGDARLVPVWGSAVHRAVIRRVATLPGPGNTG